jgi:hypothetical protein
MDLGEIGWDDMDWIDVAQDRDQWRGSPEGSQEGLSSMSEEILSFVELKIPTMDPILRQLNLVHTLITFFF